MLLNKESCVLIFNVFSCLCLTGCSFSAQMSTTAIPVVQNIDIEKYLGTWYEIARLPNSFERNLDQVTATYTWREDGKIKVLNRGFNTEKNIWKEATGKAWIPDPDVPSRLRVSFFLFFASDYRIIALDDENYSYAMVTSNSMKYLWVLSRDPQMDTEVYDRLTKQAQAYGFDIEKLYRVTHS
ncbi:MAG: lipocalin family protein [Candidatus Cloacimonetes bacterium]|nr:lipocalin family protein [Candidatus Cloacimonadota bacterium]